MEQFKLVNLFNNISPTRSSKLYRLLTQFKYIMGDDCARSEELVYIKNYYKYSSGQCNLNEVEIYKVKNDRFYRVFFSNDLAECCVEFYPLSEVKNVCLKESKRYSQSNFDLSIFFKDGASFNLNSLNDTFEELGSDILSNLILDVYSSL